ncbi:unnamed protein product, partial [Urochloa humidicola]
PPMPPPPRLHPLPPLHSPPSTVVPPSVSTTARFGGGSPRSSVRPHGPAASLGPPRRYKGYTASPALLLLRHTAGRVVPLLHAAAPA